MNSESNLKIAGDLCRFCLELSISQDLKEKQEAWSKGIFPAIAGHSALTQHLQTLSELLKQLENEK